MGELQVDWERIGHVLMVLFVLAVVFEVALSSVFNWRFFAKKLEGKGAKTPITWAVALALLWAHDIDIFREILQSLDKGDGGTDTAAWITNVTGRLMTALLVAGGSQGIFNIMVKLKIRNPDELRKKAEDTRKREAEQKKKEDEEEEAKKGQTGQPE